MLTPECKDPRVAAGSKVRDGRNRVSSAWRDTDSTTVGVLREVKRVRSDFSVLSGWEDLILTSLLAGANGSICAFANVAPELLVELVRSAQSGDLGKAAELHRRVLLLVTLGVYSDPPLAP